MTDEAREENLVWHALYQLNNREPLWSKNFLTYRAMPLERRLWWWDRAKQQAEAGVPAMQQLVLEVIKLRMTS